MTPSPSAAPLTPAQAQQWLTLMDEPAVLVDGTTAWTSPALRRLCADLAEHAPLATLTPALPGLMEAIVALGDTGRDAPVPLTLGPDAAWDARARRLDSGAWIVRLRSRREQVQALQRQLDDREQLLFTSRVISVGEMATTLAHELNQPIGAANNLLRGLRMRLGRRSGAAALTPQEATALDQSIEQLMFAARVIARVREFTHSRQPRQQRIDLNALVREAAALLDWDLQRDPVRLDLQLPDEPLVVRGDATLLQQVIVNLMRNALDAMRQARPSQPLLTLLLRPSESGRDATLTVRDNGCGLTDAVQSQLFVPFHSTKPTGMGVGLAICRSFVELHQGRLWFSRNADQGCSFHVDLPLAPDSPAATAPAVPVLQGALHS